VSISRDFGAWANGNRDGRLHSQKRQRDLRRLQIEGRGRVSDEAMKFIEAYKQEDREKIYERLFSKQELSS
jgi:hypothetical protein